MGSFGIVSGLNKNIKIFLYLEIGKNVLNLWTNVEGNIMATFKLNIEQKLNKEVSTLFKSSTTNYKFVQGKSNVTYDDFLSNKMLIIIAIRMGIPYSFLI